MNARIIRSLRRTVVFPVLVALMALLTSVEAFAVALGTPTITAGNPTQTTIDITFTAKSPGGAPAGFTIQWMTEADYLANGFSSTLPLGCDASFSGNARNSRYALLPDQSITLTVGKFTNDAGFSTHCGAPLVCGTTYVFRAFSHANSTWGRSDFTDIITASTLACSGGCALSQGYWKTHGPIPVGKNLNTWPATVLVNGLTLGTHNYTALELLSILNQPPLGNVLVSLARQLIAVRLSELNGADTTAIAAEIADADALIDGLVVPPVGTDSFVDPDDQAAATLLTEALDAWISTHECNKTGS